MYKQLYFVAIHHKTRQYVLLKSCKNLCYLYERGACLTFLPHGGHIGISNLDGVCLQTLTGHTNWIEALAITSDNLIVTAALHMKYHASSISADNTAKVWNLDGECLQTLRGHSGDINTLAITSDNRIVS